MTKLRPMTARELCALLSRLGYTLKRSGKGSHSIFHRRPDEPLVIVPMHRGDIPRGTLRGIINDLGMTPEEFEQARRR